MKRLWIIITSVVLMLAVGGGSFYGGMLYGQSRGPRWNRQFPPEGIELRQGRGQVFQGTEQGDRPGAGFPVGGVMGTIQSINGNILVINTADGAVKIEAMDSTLIQKTISVSVADLEVDARVMVLGRENDDGTITARSILPMSIPQTWQVPEGQ